MQTGESSLIAACKQGDAEALRQLFLAHKDRVYRVALACLVDSSAAEDITQEVFVSLPQRLRGFRSEATLSTFLYRVTVNLCRDELRRRQRASRSLPGSEPEDALVDAGLFPDEATGMVRTWESSWLGTEGVRALFLLPQGWTDAAIPMTIIPKPASLVRVMLGRIELLTPAREQAAAKAALQATSTEPSQRRRGHVQLRAEGRYLEPILRHLQKTSPDTRVRAACEKLLRDSPD